MSELGRSQVALEILAYLAENPTAQDTMLGIVEWWLLEQQIKTQTYAVKDALADLVSRGLIFRHQGKDSQIHYRINMSKMDAVLALIAGRET